MSVQMVFVKMTPPCGIQDEFDGMSEYRAEKNSFEFLIT